MPVAGSFPRRSRRLSKILPGTAGGMEPVGIPGRKCAAVVGGNQKSVAQKEKRFPVKTGKRFLADRLFHPVNVGMLIAEQLLTPAEGRILFKQALQNGFLV